MFIQLYNCAMDIYLKLKDHVTADIEWSVLLEDHVKSTEDLLLKYNLQLSQASIWVLIGPMKFFATNNNYYLNMFGMWSVGTPATRTTPAVHPKFLFYKTVEHFLAKLGGDGFVLFWVKVTKNHIFKQL